MRKIKLPAATPSLLASVIIFSLSSTYVSYSRVHAFVQERDLQAVVDRYENTLNLLFPREKPDFRRTDYRIVLRFQPSFAPESQITISHLKDGTTVVVSYSLPGERSTVQAHIDKLVMQGIEDAAQIAKQIKVKRTEVRLSDGVLEGLIQGYSQLRISPSLDTRITLDPTTYELSYEATANSLQISLSGPEYAHAPKADPIIRWMDEVRLAVLQAQQTLQ